MQLLSAKYLSDTHIFHNPINRGASYSWQSILKAVDFLKWGFINRVGRGNISLWYERWLHKGRLCDMVPYVHISDINLQISDLCVSDTWHFDHLNTILPLDVRLEMQSVFTHESSDDLLIWEPSSSGEYSTKSAYSWLIDNDEDEENDQNQTILWNWV